MQLVSGTPYSKRPVPPPPSTGELHKWAATLAAFFGNELGNIQRGTARATSRTVTTSWTATAGDGLILVDTTSGNVSVTLPDPNTVRDMVLTVKRVTAGANTVTVVGTIDGVANKSLPAQWDAVTLWAHVPSAGAGTWYITAEM